ncbi:hypothetical protein [Egbenema bharatensis]|uniref:hypothetical protein n=1 Tax=Egbenema bharatensis TaxID=3463334 RepID=UPI003A87E439
MSDFYSGNGWWAVPTLVSSEAGKMPALRAPLPTPHSPLPTPHSPLPLRISPTKYEEWLKIRAEAINRQKIPILFSGIFFA